jgi:peptidoglycan recognition protein
MKFFLIISFATLAWTQTPCDNIRTRAQWGSRTTTLTNMPTLPPSGFAVHHTAGARCTTQAACDTQMRSLQNFHMNVNGYTDIAFNFCVGDPGQIYEGRGYSRLGAHAPGFNQRALGHCFFGDHTTTLPSAAALANTQLFIDCTRQRGHLSPTHWVSTHSGDALSNTVCPGIHLQVQVENWARFNPNP